jgi:hypothetical protein
MDAQLELFKNKIDQLKDKARSILDKAKSQESNSDKYEGIKKNLQTIKDGFNRGHYKEMIVDELEKNYIQIKSMNDKLQREEKEDKNLNDKIASLERSTDT